MIDRAHIKETTTDSPIVNNNTPVYSILYNFTSFKRGSVSSEKMRVTSTPEYDTVAAGGTD